MPFVADKLILFGATGDLSQRMLLPSLCALNADGLVSEDLKIIGTARSGHDDESFRAFAGDALEKYLPDDRKSAIPALLAAELTDFGCVAARRVCCLGGKGRKGGRWTRDFTVYGAIIV